MTPAGRGRGGSGLPPLLPPPACRDLIETLQLQAHPEGGWYREWYRCPVTMPVDTLPGEFKGERALVTAIYYLLSGGAFSAWHRIRSDELWLFLAGGALEIHQIDSTGIYSLHLLGPDHPAGETLNHTVPARTWFAARLRPGSAYSLVNCIVAPGFDFRDFELGQRKEMLALFPDHAALINELTRQQTA